jgi:tetratricopeptide (TPR) repeat protein
MIRLSVIAALLAGCPTGSTTEPTDETQGDEIEFPDEREARERDANAPAASAEVERAERLLAEGEASEARELLEAAVRENPNDARAQLDLGLAFELEENVEGAERAYRASIAADPSFPEPHNNLGLLLRDLDRGGEAIAELREAIRLRPDFASAHVNLALALEESGDVGGAIEIYRTAVRLAPRDPMTRVNFGLALLASGNAEQAAIEFRRALPLAGENPAALQAVGNGLRRVEQFDLAVTAMERAVEAMGDEVTPALLSELALAYRANDDREGAERTLNRALEVDPRYATAHYLLGNMLAGRGAFAEAIRHYERYLALEPQGELAARVRDRLREARERR